MADDAVIDQLAQQIASVESGGRYDAVGPPTKGDRPYGKYQVMGANIPKWTQEATGTAATPEQFIANPDLQEQTVRHRLGAEYDKYGNAEDVASVWHSGVPLSQARAEGRKDVLGTSTEDYAAKVGSGMGDTAPDEGLAQAAGVRVQLPDGNFVDLGPNPTPEMRQQVKDKILAKWPDLAPKASPPAVEPSPETTFRDMSVEDSAKLFNTSQNLPEDHWLGKYSSAVAKPYADALHDLYEGVKQFGSVTAMPAEGTTLTDDMKNRLTTILKPLHLLGATGEAAGNVAFQGAMDAGLPPWGAAAIGTLVSIVTGAKMPLVPGLGKAGAAVEEGVNAAEATAGEAASAANTARTAASQASEAIAPSVEQATAAKAALNPVPVEEAGSTLQAGRGKLYKGARANAQALYDDVSTKAADRGLALEPTADQSEQLSADINNMRQEFGATLNDKGEWVGGTIVGQKKKVLDDIDAALQSGEPIPYPQLETFKRVLDDVLPEGKNAAGRSLKAERLYQFKHSFRDTMRGVLEDADPELASTFDDANTMWRESVVPARKLAGAMDKRDPSEAFNAVFGTGKTPKTASNVARYLKDLTPDDANTVKNGFFTNMIDKASNADGSLDPAKLLKNWDDLNGGFRDAISNPGAKSFFEGIRDQVGAAKRGEQWAKSAEKYAKEAGTTVTPKTKTPMWATMTAHGLRLGAGAAVGHTMGHALLGAAIGHNMIGIEELAAALADPKKANLLARAVRTPIDSQLVPTLAASIANAGISNTYGTKLE